MSKKIQVTFEDWQYEKVVGRAAKYEMNVSAYVRYCVLEHEYVSKSLDERSEQVSGLKELLFTHGIVIPRELRG